MNKTDLIAAVAEKSGTSKANAKLVIDSVLETITESLAKSTEVSLPGFGSFSVKAKPERKGRNPRTGEDIVIPARNSITFKAGKQLKERV